jgi:hypothetical protein
LDTHVLKRALVWCVAATLLLPVLLAVLLGLGGLLAAVGDPAAARACSRAGLAVGVLWITAVVGTSAVTAIAVVALPQPPRPRGRKLRRRRRRPPTGLDREPPTRG